MWRQSLLFFVGTAAVILAGSGCLVPYESTLETDEVLKQDQSRTNAGLIWMFPGLVGQPWELAPAYRGLRDAGINREFHFYQWADREYDIFGRLERDEFHRADARRVAEEIAAYAQGYEGRPIDLVGYSAGAFLALAVVEQLPPEVRVDRLILVQPSISPRYDLTLALAHVDGGIVCLYSPRDRFLSGAFCTVFGTMDRVFEPSAGMVGLDLEAAVPDPVLRGSVVQLGWSEEWADAGHPGNHMAILQYRFNRLIIAPLLSDRTGEARGR